MLWLSILIAVPAAAGTAWLLYRADRLRGVPYPWVTAALRGMLVFLTLFLLLAPPLEKKSRQTRQPVIVWIQDHSTSVAAALGKDSSAYRNAVSVFLKRLSGSFKVVTRNLDGPSGTDSLFRFRSPVTDLATAIDAAAAQYGQQNLGAVILASDGRYNQGANPAYSSLPVNSALYTIAIGDTSLPKDLRITKTYANRTVSLNSQFEIRADISATRCAGYRQTATLTDASGQTVGTAVIAAGTDRYDGTVSFSVQAKKPGLQHYVLSLPDAGSEANTANNKASIYVEVTAEKKRVLVLAAAPHPDIKAIQEAMKGLEQFQLELRMATDLPADLSAYAAVILHQLPAVGMNIPEQLRQSALNTWYITGPQSLYPQLNQLQQLVQFQSGLTIRDAEPACNTAFNLFSLPAEIRAVTDLLPPLSVAAGESRATGGAAALFTQQNGQALWAFSQSGRPGAILCGEGLWRWRLYEYKHTGRHQVIDACIRQTITFLTTNHNGKPFRTELPKYIWSYPEALSMNAYLVNNNNEPINEPEAQLLLKDSAGREQRFVFERNANIYRINTGILAPGKYSYTAQTTYKGKTYSDAGSFIVAATTLEAMETGCDYAGLYALARKNQGQVFQPQQLDALYDSLTHHAAIRPLISETTEQAPLIDRRWLFFLILAVATAEWLLRKYWLAM